MKKGNLLSRTFWLAGLALALSATAAIWLSRSSPAQTRNRKSVSPPSSGAPRQVQIDLDQAVAVTLPEIKDDLKAAFFRTADGKQGWAVRLPGGRPIATPAFADGMIFVGGGYGSHEFYAMDAQTGRVVWQMKTKDDGPTAAVVEDGCVAFNTESCTVIVAEAKTGKIIWQEWLGDPLMSQPAISKGRLYIAYPAGQRKAQPARTGHRLLCVDLKTGRHLWEQAITGDVISAPVVSGDQLYFTCFDGTSFCLKTSDGAVVWKKQNAGTSAPIIADGQVIMTHKEQKDGKAYEGLRRRDAERGEERDQKLLAAGEAEYLEKGKGGGVALSSQTTATLDSSVGFSTAPSTAQIAKANDNVGVSTVAGAWAYQGSRAAYKNGRMLNAQGKYLNSILAADGSFAWRAEVKGAGLDKDAQVFSPPSLGDRNMYLCSSLGHLLSVRQQDGAVGFIYALKQPMAFQPALAQGNIYVGTVNGLIICLKTGDKDADGWYAWGGNAQHNKHE